LAAHLFAEVRWATLLPQLNHTHGFGDFRAMYELVQVGRFSMIRDPYTSKGNTKLYLAARYLGRVVNNDAVKLVSR